MARIGAAHDSPDEDNGVDVVAKIAVWILRYTCMVMSQK